MGNNPSSTSKSGSPAGSGPVSGSPSSQTSSPHHHHHHHRKDGIHSVSSRERNWSDGHGIIPHHTTQRSAAPPEASLAQAQATVVNRPKSLPPTALSSLSGSPHSQSSTPVKHSESSPLAVRDAQQKQVEEATKPVDVPSDPSTTRSPPSASQTDSQLVSNSSMVDMYLPRPPRMPLPIEEEVHTPGSPILAPDEGPIPAADLQESLDGLTRKSSGLSAGTVGDEDEELRVDRTRPVVPTKLEWLRGGDKVYVTGTIFQWNRKQRLHPV